MNPSNRLLKASNLTNQRPEFLESYIRIFDSFDSSFIQKIRKIQLQLPALILREEERKARLAASQLERPTRRCSFTEEVVVFDPP